MSRSAQASGVGMRPSFEQVRHYFSYEPGTGLLRWKEKTGCKTVPGAIAGREKGHGYVVVGFLCGRYYAHQIIWLWMTGEWPPFIDHRNRNRSDNRWENLREATRSINNRNRDYAKKKFLHLPRGVLRRVNRGGSISFVARICINNKQVHLGTRKTPVEAHSLYLAAESRL